MARDVDALVGFIADRADMPFRWGRGRNDCIAFATKAAKKMTGRDLLGDLQWRNRREAMALLRRLGGLEKAVDDRLPRIAPSMAMRGDFAGVEDPELGLRLMVVEGATLAGPGTSGVERMPREAMVAAWSIEDPSDG